MVKISATSQELTLSETAARGLASQGLPRRTSARRTRSGRTGGNLAESRATRSRTSLPCEDIREHALSQCSYRDTVESYTTVPFPLVAMCCITVFFAFAWVFEQRCVVCCPQHRGGRGTTSAAGIRTHVCQVILSSKMIFFALKFCWIEILELCFRE